MTQGRREDKCLSARAGKKRAPVALKGAALTRRPFHYADVLMGASVTKFFTQNPVKNFAFCPGQVRQAVAVMPLAAKVLKRVKFIPQGIQQQVPAKRQNRGSRNSTGDVL
ncbi:hypothetical protein ACPF8M_25720 (plasmid) [Escherichia coli]